jgi:hypothetical protein
MKPGNWNEMTETERRDDAIRLFESMRGRLIIGQALARAVAVMSEEKYPEASNISDMEELGETLFSPWFSVYVDRLKKADA